MFFRARWRPGSLIGGLGIVVGFVLMAGSVYVFFNRPSLAALDNESVAANTAEISADEADEETGEDSEIQTAE